MTPDGFLLEIANLSDIHVTYEPLWAGPSSGMPQTIMVGSAVSATPAGSTPVAAAPLLLTNHGAALRHGLKSDPTSVSRTALLLPQAYLQSFPATSSQIMPPAAAVAGLHFVVDDASPDSVLAVLILLARLAGLAPETVIPSEWVDAIDEWERIGTVTNPATSWCALASALVHRHFPLQGAATSNDLRSAWLDALHFLAKSIAGHLTPVAMPASSSFDELLQARAALDQEQQAYLDWLDSATRVQLSLPMQGCPGRRMLVDGLLIEAEQITGSAKVFFRNDVTNSPLGKGFSFSGVYLPAIGDLPEDITFSIDPNRGFHLRELWQALENAESLAWAASGQARPTDRPRLLAGVANTFTQPWYIDPSGTLIGRPRALPDGRSGSLLSWTQVREILWHAYNPLREVYVLPGRSQKVHLLLEIQPEEQASHHRCTLFLGKWMRNPHGAGSQPLPFRPSTSFGRILAGKLAHGSAPGQPFFAELPPSSTWTAVKLSGGIAVASVHGLFVLDDWSGEQLDMEAIRASFNSAARLDADLHEYEQKSLRPIVERVHSLLARERAHADTDTLLLEIARLSAQLSALHGTDAILPVGADAALVRDALEKHLQWKARLDRFEHKLKTLETSLRGLGEMNTLRIGRFIATYGFALVFSSTLAPFVAKAIYHLHHAGEAEAPGFWILSAAAIVAVLLLIILKLWLALEDPLSGYRRHKTERHH